MDKILLRPQFTIHYRTRPGAAFHTEPSSGYTVLLLLSGKIHAETENQKLTLDQSGDILLINPGPGVMIRDATNCNESAEYAFLIISPAYLLDCALRTHFARGDSVIIFRDSKIEHDAKAERIARDMAEELAHEETGQVTVVTALVEQLLVHLLRRYSTARRSDELELSRAGLVDRRIRRAVELMHAHLAEDLPLEELAAAAYLSPFHFSRLFKKLTGTTPHAYLAALRTAQARTLLAGTDYSITEIAARVGYTSPSHFTKAFRESTGLTPRAFRAALVKAVTGDG